MSQITITFNIPDEDLEMRNAINGHKYAGILFDFDQQLRQTTKYGTSLTQNGSADQTEQNYADTVRNLLREIAERWDVTWSEIES